MCVWNRRRTKMRTSQTQILHFLQTRLPEPEKTGKNNRAKNCKKSHDGVNLFSFSSAMFSSTLFSLFLYRHFFSTTTTTTTTITKLPRLSKIPSRHRSFALREAQKALTEYLHGTRCLPFTYAEHIGNKALCSLTSLIAKVDFSAPTFSKSFEKFLRYHPVNEFEVFFESIGIEYSMVSELLPHDKVFFSQDGTLLDAACALCDFGFPWEKLGALYTERSSIFGSSAAELKKRLCGFKGCGFGNVEVIGICLAFPFVLSEEGQVGVGRIEGLFIDLKLVFLDFGLGKFVEGDVDSWHEACRKLRVFFNLDGGNGDLAELMGRNKSIFIEHREEELVSKVEYFCRFGAKNKEVARLILQCPELLKLNLETPVVNVLKLLKHFGLSSKDMEDVSRNYAHVLGTNKMANLPNAMRALGLQNWFFSKIKDGHHCLLADFISRYPSEDQDKDFQDGLRIINISRARVHNINKLNFLHGLGFGENALTVNLLNHLHGTSSELQERFDCLLHSRIGFSKLCMMVRMTPRILNQNSEIIERKVDFFHREMGITLDRMDTFPAILYYHLEDRIIPRYRFHMWLTEKGLCCKKYSIRSMIVNNEKKFVARVYKIHPAAPKHWFEQFRHCKFPV